MKVGIVANIMQDKTLAEALDYFRKMGIQTIEPGCGGYAGKSHVNPTVLLGDKEKIDEFKRIIADSGLTISALSCHGNPIHPDQGIAAAHDGDMRDTVRLCKELGLDTITCFSGCAGDCPDSKFPNWVTCPWPDDYLKILDYQWNEVLIPYWREFAAFAKENGVTKIALELHPGFMVYNSETLKRLRGEVGREIGVNFDPSHPLWQGMDPVSVIRELKDAIYHVHAKDVKVDLINTAVNGVLDTKHYSNEINRSWIFRTIGYGNDTAYWKNIFSTLRIIGYDGAVSIEHEDSLINRFEGLEKAVRIVKESLIMEDKTEMWWA